MYKILLTKPKLVVGISLALSSLVVCISLFGLLKIIMVMSEPLPPELGALNPAQKFEEAMELILTKTVSD